MINIFNQTENKEELAQKIDDEFFNDLVEIFGNKNIETYGIEYILELVDDIIYNFESLSTSDIRLVETVKLKQTDVILAKIKYIGKIKLLENLENLNKIKEYIENLPGPKKLKNKETKKGFLIKKFKNLEKNIENFSKGKVYVKGVGNIFIEIEEILKYLPKDMVKIKNIDEKNFFKEKVKKKKIQNSITETKNEVSIILDKLSSIKQRIENIETKEKNKDYTDELQKILLNLNKIDKNENSNQEIKDEITEIEEKIFQIILQKSKKIEENQKVNSKISEKKFRTRK